MSLKEFQVIAKLGEGAYSSVYKVKRVADQQEYALKKVKLANLSDKEKQNALNEVRILASIRCLNIVAYKEVFLDAPSNSLCIVMEYVNHGDLYQKIVECQKKNVLIPEPEIWSIMIQVTRGLKALHDLKIFHRDLKSANVFLGRDGIAKLGDMNVSKIAKKGLLYTQTGTPYYASPEVWKDQPYDSKSDIWSLGCVLYEMTTLKPYKVFSYRPFRAEDMEGLYKKVIRGYYPKIPSSYSQDLNNVIRALLQVAPHLRPSCDKILQLPAVLRRMDEKLLLEADEGMPNLLQTIRVPKNMHYLTERLPKPNYSPLKLKKIDKHKFIQTLGAQGSHDFSEEQQENSSIKENHSAEYRLPRLHKRSNPPERGNPGHSAHHSQNQNSQSPGKYLDANDSYIGQRPTYQENSVEISTENQKQKRRNSKLKIHEDEKRKNNGGNQSNGNGTSLPNILNQQQIGNTIPVSGINLKEGSASIEHERSALGISQINQIYGSGIKKIVKKKDDRGNGSVKPSKPKNLAALLDIEGETKPLQIKVKKNPTSLANIRDDSEQYDNPQKLPSIIKDKQRGQIGQRSSAKIKDEDISIEKSSKKQRNNEESGQKNQHLLPDIGIRQNKHRAYDDI